MPLDLRVWGRVTGDGKVPTPPAPPFTPASIPGMLAWWDAGQNVVTSGSEITSWTSRDANAYPLTRLVYAGPQISTLLGNPAADFSGASKGLYKSGPFGLGTAIDGSDPFTCYLIGSWSASGIGQTAMRFDGQLNLQFSSAGAMQQNRSAVVTSGPTVSGNMYIAWFYNGTVASFRFDGTPNAGAANAGVPANTNMYLGHNGFAQDFKGKMAEILFYDHVLTAGEIASLEAWIVAKYPGI